MKQLLFGCFTLAMLCGISQQAKAEERRIDNVTDIWAHVKPTGWDDAEVSFTLETTVPGSAERKLEHFGPVGNTIKIFADVPADKPMYALIAYYVSSWNGVHWQKFELHIHAETKLDVGNLYTYGQRGRSTAPATHKLIK